MDNFLIMSFFKKLYLGFSIKNTSLDFSKKSLLSYGVRHCTNELLSFKSALVMHLGLKAYKAGILASIRELEARSLPRYLGSTEWLPLQRF